MEFVTAAAIATHYGFQPLPNVVVEREDLSKAKSFYESSLKEVHPFLAKQGSFAGYLEEKMALLRAYTNKELSGMTMPIMAYYEGPLSGNPHIKRSSKERTCNLEIIGNSKSIAEAMIIETAYVIAKEQYKEELVVELNSIGDKESGARFAKELTLYFKKRANEWPAECRNILRKDVFEIFNCTEEKCLELQEDAPKSMSYLSEPSRKHLAEVLEYLEALHIPYTINHKLIGSRSYCSGILFEIQAAAAGDKHARIVAIGERYNSLSRKMGSKKEIPAIGAAILLHGEGHKVTKSAAHPAKKPKYYFIQLGFEAKLKSLQILEMLRQAKIPVSQSLSKDKLLAQITTAEKMEVPYVIIMGQKEALEGSVVVRDMNTRSQDTVFLSELVTYLKKLK